MSSRFFTNQESNTLKNVINEALLNDKNIAYLDFLIGYFRMTGFDKIASNLSHIDFTRVLVGINADKETYDASQIIKKFAKEQVNHYNKEPLDEKEYQNFLSMQKLIEDKKIAIRISLNRDVHAKMYIMRSDKIRNHIDDGYKYRGSVIIGSSNLTHNGLEANIETNAELKDDKSLLDAVEVFENIWEKSVELTLKDFDKYIKPFLKKPQQKEKFSQTITPYQFYIKFLIEHFGAKIDFIEDSHIFLPKSYKKLSYQVEAVNDGLDKLKKHHGFFLSDVVGLGKTIVIAMLIKKLEDSLDKKVLIVIPPAVKVQWEDTLIEFQIKNYDIISLASLHSINAKQYELIIVDESHKFKNRESKRYKALYEICLNKKVILISATPQNNTPYDLFNQIALFQNVKNSTLNTCTNLQAYFVEKEQSYKTIINSEPIDKEVLEKLSIDIRDTILRTIMIRRTRYDIENHTMYKEDIESQNLSIPKVQTPKEHQYILDKKLDKIFNETARLITKKLQYSRFNALSYLTLEAREKYYPKESSNLFDFNPLAGLMKVLLVKRFESSFFAFKISINRHLARYKVFIENFEANRVYLGKKASDILDYEGSELEKEYDDFIEDLKYKGKVKELPKDAFEKEFISHIKSDYTIFQALVNLWKEIEEDPKVDKFIEVIEDEALDKNPYKKIVIFTESVDTLEYLKRKLPNKRKILFITSQNREEKKESIKENFDANCQKEKQKNNYNIIITTDTLAEGINLHRANIIYNYDIPWNATKLIQRIGRVNRIGTKANFIYIHNFKPASNIEALINLSKKAFVKLQSSHTMMGEDNQIYTKDETVSSVTLFNEYKKISNEKDEMLDYLEELREFRKHHTEEFNYLSKLKELHITRNSNREKAYLSLDINNHKNYICVKDNVVTPISFIEMAKNLKASPDEVVDRTQNKYIEEYISKSITYFEDEFKKEKQDKADKSVNQQNEQKAIRYLKEWLKRGVLNRKEFKEYTINITNGLVGILTINEINKLFHLEDKIIKEQISFIMTKKKVQEKLFNEELIVTPLLSEVFIFKK